MKLAILSDTHGLLRPEVTEHLKTADAILHGGDINRQSIVDELRQYAPLYIVRGNNDKDWAASLPLDLRFSLGGLAFHMVHDKRDLPADLAGVDVVVYGHSHRYAQEVRGGVLYPEPRLPAGWPECAVRWRDGAGLLHTIRLRPDGVTADEKPYDGGGIGKKRPKPYSQDR